MGGTTLSKDSAGGGGGGGGRGVIIGWRPVRSSTPKAPWKDDFPAESCRTQAHKDVFMLLHKIFRRGFFTLFCALSRSLPQ